MIWTGIALFLSGMILGFAAAQLYHFAKRDELSK